MAGCPETAAALLIQEHLRDENLLKDEDSLHVRITVTVTSKEIDATGVHVYIRKHALLLSCICICGMAA